MQCKKFRMEIIDLLTGELDKNKEREVIDHIKNCEKCRNIYNETKVIIEESKKIKIPGFSNEWWESKMSAIFEKSKAKKIVIIKRKVAYTLISFLFIISIGVLLLNRSDSNLTKNKKVPSSFYTYSNTSFSIEDLPFTMKEIYEMADYMTKEEAKEVLKVVLR